MKREVIRIDPVEHDLYVYVGKDKNYLDIIHNDFKNIGDISDTWDGFHAYQHLKNGELAHLIYLEKKDLGLMVHELIHCVKTVMDLSGIDNEEFMAYTCQHLFYEIQKIFRG